MTDMLQRKRYATILRAYADKVENGSVGIDYVLRSNCSYVGREGEELDLAKQEVVDNVEVNLRDLGPDCDVDEIFGWDDLGIYVPLFTPRFSNVRPACAICYDGFEFFADVSADFANAPKESTDVEPHLCSGHMSEIEKRIKDMIIPNDILGVYWRTKREEEK